MSTWYYFYCTKCKKYQKDITFARQGAGYGAAKIIDTFQFIMKHTDECGHENIRLCSEHDDIIDSAKDKNPKNYPHNGYTKDTSEDLKGCFPLSEDWDKKVSDERLEEYRKFKESRGY